MHEDAHIETLFERLRDGDASAREELFPIVYAELHGLARRHMSKQRAAHTLQASALVNEAYLKLSRGGDWNDAQHFMRLASRVMRQILVNHARKRAARPHQCRTEDVHLDAVVVAFDESAHGLVELDAALEKLEQRDPQLAQLVDLRYFGGRSWQEIADALDVSLRTVTRGWSVARAWIRKELERA